MSSGSRPLLPRPDTSLDGGGGGNPGSDAASHGKTQKRKRAQVAAACERCRSRKHRCDGLRPTCSPCLAKGLPCTYRLPAGETHDSYRRRQVEQLHHSAAELERVVQLIRESPEDETQGFVRQLKESPTIGEAIALIMGQQSDPQPRPFMEASDLLRSEDETEASDAPVVSTTTTVASAASGTGPGTLSPGHGGFSIKGMYGAAELAGAGHSGGGGGGSSQSRSGRNLEEDKMRLKGDEADTSRAAPSRQNWHWFLRPTAPEASRDGANAAAGGDWHQVGSTAELALRTLQQHQPQYNKGPDDADTVRSTSSGPAASGGSPFFFDGSTWGFGNLPRSSAIYANNYPAEIQRRQVLRFSVPEHAFLPLSTEPDNAIMASVPFSFRNAAQEALSSGQATVASVIGVTDPSIDTIPVYVDLFFREKMPGDDPLNVCNFACEMMKGLSMEFDQFILLAAVSSITRYMRWSIVPSQTYFAQMSEMTRPLPSQRLLPHSPALDICPHPAFREALMRNYRDWVSVGMSSIGESRIWPFNLDEAVEIDPANGRKRLTAKFENWAAVPEHWTLNANTLDTFPEIEDFGVILRGAD